jgi:4-carboxymuconolactone decarboxylase
MELKELYARGLKLRRQLFGKEIVDQRMSAAGEFGDPLQQIVNAYCYGDTWSRPGLPNATRSLAVLAITAAINRPNEFRVHMNGALNNGCTAEEIREVLLLVSMYCGIPAAADGHRIAHEVLTERNKKN